MDATPVIARGHNVAVFVPPVPEAARPVIEAALTRPILILTADSARAEELADRLAGAFAVTGLARAKRRLAAATPDIVASGVAEALELLHRSALHPAAFACLVLAWPEQQDAEAEAALSSIMAECDKDAQRLILTARTGPATDALVERYAFKALAFGFPAAGESQAPVGPARCVIGRASRLAELRNQVLDALNSEHEDQVVIAACPASREAALAIAAGAGGAGGEPPVIVAEAHQLGWLRSLFSPLSTLHLPGAGDLAGRRAEQLRARIAQTIESEDLDRELLTLGPLLSRMDPALVAAAALRLAPTGTASPGAGTRAAAPPAQGIPSIAKIWIGIGRKDSVKPGDLVGAIVNEAGVSAEAIGKIEVRDLFCLVDIRGDAAEQVVKGLTGKTVRGRRLVARVDRGPGAKPPRRA